MSNSIDPDETAHYEPSHLDLCCLQKPIIIACGNERVNLCCPDMTQRHKFAWHDPCYSYKDKSTMVAGYENSVTQENR